VFGEVVAGWDVMMAINRLDKHAEGRAATIAAAGCLRNCEPRQEVRPRCTQREESTRQVQSRAIKPCLN
jgi:hypothetical protein